MPPPHLRSSSPARPPCAKKSCANHSASTGLPRIHMTLVHAQRELDVGIALVVGIARCAWMYESHCTCSSTVMTVQTCTVMSRSVQICTDLYRSVRGCSGLCRYVQICTGLYRSFPVCTNLYRFVQIWRRPPDMAQSCVTLLQHIF